MSSGNVRELSAKWREEAELFRRRGAIEAAATLEGCADELDNAFRLWCLEALTLERAAEESGYSYAHLQRLVCEGQLENVGKHGSPRIRRCDLPRKTGRASRRGDGERDLADEILARRGAGLTGLAKSC